MYSDKELYRELQEWKGNLIKVTHTTGTTNFDMLQDNLFFKSFFPNVTTSDRIVINKLLKEINKYRN